MTAPAAIETVTAPAAIDPAMAPAAIDAVTPPNGVAPVVDASVEAAGGDQPAVDPIPPATVAEAAPAAQGEGVAAETPVARTDGSEFQAKLARAMHTIAARERTTIGDDAERRRQAQVQAIRERATVEVERIRELAADDMKAIETWAAGEENRIKLEREQRVTALNEDLELSLTEHGAKIDEEVKAAEAAIATYRTAVDSFFAGLDYETDPMVIARQAATYPAFPKLPETAETSSRGADAGPAVVGVMSPAPAGGSLETAIAAVAGSPTLIGVEDPAPSIERVDAPVPVGAPAGPSGGAAGQEVSALQALLAARSNGRPPEEANGTGGDSQG